MTGSWERICRADDVPADRPNRSVVRVHGEAGSVADEPVCVVARGDCDYVALLDRCPHRDIALSGGIVRDGLLICPGHFWRFDLRTGARTDALGPTDLHATDIHATVYSTRIVDGWVEARIPTPVQRLSMREWLLAEAQRRSAPHG